MAERAVKPGDERWTPAERPDSLRVEEWPRFHRGSEISSALAVAEREGVSRSGLFHGIPRDIIAAWQALDAGEEPEMPAEQAFTRAQHAFASLPEDARCELAGEAEARAWRYHAPDIEHARIVAERERAASQETRQRQCQEAQQAHERAAAAHRELAEATRERVAAWEAKAQAERAQAERDQAASEKARRESERERRVQALVADRRA